MNSKPCRKVFTETILDLAKANKDILVVTSDARGSVTLNEFADELPLQFVETGIAEQNAVGIGAGLAIMGKKVFVCGPACFYTARALEQIKVDVAYTGTNVKIIGVSGGVSYGALGSTHHSIHDIAVMRALPGISVVLPCDNRQTAWLTRELANTEGPFYIRMGRGAVPDVYSKNDVSFTLGKANTLMEGDDITLIGTGETVYHVLKAGELLRQHKINARVLDMHTLKPLDKDAIIAAARETGYIITVEEHSIHGGLGEAVAGTVVESYPVPVKIIGFPDIHVVHGSSKELFHHYGLTAENIVKQVLTLKKVRI
ncbi:MAG: transketolase family protein [Bacteroidota bacterium]